MKHGRFELAVVVAVAVLVCIGLGMYASKRGEKHPLGMNLVAKYEPFQLYIYADTASTNKYPDYLVCEGNHNLIYRENAESNTVETTYFENGDQVLMIRRKDKKLLERMVSYHDDLGRVQYTYIDKDGDGLWQSFFDQTKGLYYVRSNLCWVLRYQVTNQMPSGSGSN